jgi:hypothetical protein
MRLPESYRANPQTMQGISLRAPGGAYRALYRSHPRTFSLRRVSGQAPVRQRRTRYSTSRTATTSVGSTCGLGLRRCLIWKLPILFRYPSLCTWRIKVRYGMQSCTRTTCRQFRTIRSPRGPLEIHLQQRIRQYYQHHQGASRRLPRLHRHGGDVQNILRKSTREERDSSSHRLKAYEIILSAAENTFPLPLRPIRFR